MRYWSATNPNVLLETLLHPQKVTVWCGFHAGGVIGPYFFVDENDRHVTVIQSININDMWFQQDGATSHTARVTSDLLEGKFGERVISRNGPVEWPLRICDLTPLDFFLWGHIKPLVYGNKPTTLDNLRQYPTRNCQSSARNVCQSGGKLGPENRPL